jgi:hypothetical protein
MTLLLTALLLVVFCAALAFGLIAVLQDLFDGNVHDSPAFQDPGPIFHDQSSGHAALRSQFAWQSRSHCRGPD